MDKERDIDDVADDDITEELPLEDDAEELDEDQEGVDNASDELIDDTTEQLELIELGGSEIEEPGFEEAIDEGTNVAELVEISETDDEELESEEEEEALDEILKQQFEPLEEQLEEADTGMARETSEEGAIPLDVQPDEFVCPHCFLIKKRSQLADTSTQTCRDCIAAA